MTRREINTADLKTEQKAPIILDTHDVKGRSGDIIIADKPLDKDYAEALAFMEEPVTVLIQPSAEKNAPTMYPIWANGKGVEIHLDNRWHEVTYLKVGVQYVIKRKYLEVMLRAKQDFVTHDAPEATENPENRVSRRTSSLANITIIADANPKGPAWVTELLRRNY